MKNLLHPCVHRQLEQCSMRVCVNSFCNPAHVKLPLYIPFILLNFEPTRATEKKLWEVSRQHLSIVWLAHGIIYVCDERRIFGRYEKFNFMTGCRCKLNTLSDMSRKPLELECKHKSITLSCNNAAGLAIAAIICKAIATRARLISRITTHELVLYVNMNVSHASAIAHIHRNHCWVGKDKDRGRKRERWMCQNQFAGAEMHEVKWIPSVMACGDRKLDGTAWGLVQRRWWWSLCTQVPSSLLLSRVI